MAGSRAWQAWAGWSVVAALLLGGATVHGGEALHDRVDALVEAARTGPAAALATDAEFLRRVSIDLVGMPPSADELRSFLADPAPDRRAKAVDRLLASPLFARRMAEAFDVMLMERRPNTNVPADDWNAFLVAAFRENRPLNVLFRQILSASGAEKDLRAAARFYLDRGSEPNLITRDVGRMVFGRDLQCAQCHDHPLIDDYAQFDYHGLLAFFSPGYPLTRKEDGKDKVYYAEKAGGDLRFDSVFVKDDKHLTGPRLPGGPELAEELPPPGDEYDVKPVGDAVSVPKVSRRAKLAELVASGTNRAFNENLANRLWAVLMGRGLVHPLDLHHPANPASHPELLRVLGEQLAAMNFDAKAFLRELALTRTYQQAIDLSPSPGAKPEDVRAAIAGLSGRTAELTAAADRSLEAYKAAVKTWREAENALVPVADAEVQADAKHAAADKARADAQKAADDAKAAVAAKQDAIKTLNEVAAKGQEAAKKLAADKALADAAKVFSDRATALTGEIPALEKAAAEKLAAVKPKEDEVAAAAKVVVEARTKVAPVRAVVREKEQAVVAARAALTDARVAVERQQKKVEQLELLAHRLEVDAQAEAAARALVAAREAIPAAKQAAEKALPLLAMREAEVKPVEAARVAAEKVRDEARGAFASHQKIIAAIESAYNAADAARKLLPDDPTLVEASGKLKTRAEELKSTLAPIQARADGTEAELAKAAAAEAAARQALAAAVAERDRLVAAVAAAEKAAVEAEAKLNALRSESAATTEPLIASLSNTFALAQLKPLSPEQICWSVMKVTGVYDRHRQVEEAELAKAKPLDDAAKADPAKVRERAVEVEQKTHDKLKGNLGAFVSVYGAGAAQPQGDFFATADQALFAANGGSINSWVAPAGGNVSERMVAEKDLTKAADDLYMTILSRPPTPEESADVVRFLTEQSKAKPAAVQELVWGLLTSAEFRFNH